MDYPVPGGSVLVSYRIDDLDAQGKLIAHGYLREYHLGKPVILAQLRQMYQNGQRRLAIAVSYLAGGDTFALDCSSGHLTGTDLENLPALLTDAAAIGFEAFLLEMIPEWEMAYTNWQDEAIMGAGQARAYQPLKYAQILTFTYDVWTTARQAIPLDGPQLDIDLLAECANVQVGSQLWRDWCALFPAGDRAVALGFSMVPTQTTLDAIPQMYPYGPMPSVWNVHAYNGEDEMTWSQFKTACRALYWQGFIIGETSTNDPTMAAAIAADKSDLFWIHQWPIVARVTPRGIPQDRLTIDYNEYAAVGL